MYPSKIKIQNLSKLLHRTKRNALRITSAKMYCIRDSMKQLKLLIVRVTTHPFTDIH